MVPNCGCVSVDCGLAGRESSAQLEVSATTGSKSNTGDKRNAPAKRTNPFQKSDPATMTLFGFDEALNRTLCSLR